MKDKVSIRRTENGGWYALNYTRKENTRHYIRKTEGGAKSHAQKLWGKGIIFIG